MLAIIWAWMRDWGSLGDILKMEANTKRGMGSAAGMQTGGYMDMAATAFRIYNNPNHAVTNEDMASLTRGAASFGVGQFGPLGSVGSFLGNMVVNGAGGLVSNASAENGIADKTNQSIDAAKQGAGQGMDFAQQAVQTISQGMGNTVQSALASATGIQLPVTPIVSQLVQNVIGKA